VDRSKNSNTVDSVVQIFKERKVFRFALAPEGTRKKVDKLRTGFYHIAQKANVPIVMVAFDFGNKQVKIADPFLPTEQEADFKKIHTFFKGVKGKIPEYSF
jgi:1-acyl-sn-glycerol-3-phosphate acyltransferase